MTREPFRSETALLLDYKNRKATRNDIKMQKQYIRGLTNKYGDEHNKFINFKGKTVVKQ